MIVTATEIKIKNILGLLRFIVNVKRIQAQLRNTDGLVFIKYKGFRTLTGWENLESMKKFRHTGHHLNAMKNLRKIGRAKSFTWETQSEPKWDEALEKLSKVNFNSINK